MDRFDGITEILPISPMTNLFFVHVKEFMRRFPPEELSKRRSELQNADKMNDNVSDLASTANIGIRRGLFSKMKGNIEICICKDNNEQWQ